MTKIKEFYSTIEASKLLDVSVRTVQLWVENGSLSAWKTAGGHRRISSDSVNDMLQQQKPEAAKSKDDKNIVIVEDNPTVAKFYEAIIKSWGFSINIISVEDGFNGLMTIGKHQPDLLITDIYMPGMDGLQMINSLYKSEKMNADQIIVISGLSEENIHERGGIPSGISFFKKPVNANQLKSCITDKLELTVATT